MNTYNNAPPRQPAPAPSSTPTDTTVPRDYLAQSLIRTQTATIIQCAAHTSRSHTTPVYTGLTALKLCCIEIPFNVTLKACMFHVLYEARTRRPDRVDTRYLRWSSLDPTPGNLSCQHNGQRIVFTHPLVTWAILSRHLSQVEVIVLADAILRSAARCVSVSIDDIRQFLSQSPAFPGKVQCLAALPFLETVTDSPMEARTILGLLRYGLPRPQTQWPVYIRSLGRTVSVDLAYPEQQVIIEYDGDAHRIDKRQYRWDEHKRRALREERYQVIVVFADDVLTVEGCRSMAEQVARALGRPLSGQPLPQYRALLDDERRRANRARQRKRRRQRAQRGA